MFFGRLPPAYTPEVHRCASPGCDKLAAFGYSGNRWFCGTHRLEGPVRSLEQWRQIFQERQRQNGKLL